jgi:hypothetical protein
MNKLKKVQGGSSEKSRRKLQRKRDISFDNKFRLRRQKEDPLKEKDRRNKFSSQSEKERVARYKERGIDVEPRPRSTTVSRMSGQRYHVGRGPGRSARLQLATPKAREAEAEMQKKAGAVRAEGFVFSSDLLSLNEETSELEKRCVADIMAKPAKGPDGKPVKGARNRLSRAYAICRASLQKSGRIKKGTAELTKKGKGVSGAKSKSDDHESKISRFEKHVVAARKK